MVDRKGECMFEVKFIVSLVVRLEDTQEEWMWTEVRGWFDFDC